MIRPRLLTPHDRLQLLVNSLEDAEDIVARPGVLWWEARDRIRELVREIQGEEEARVG